MIKDINNIDPKLLEEDDRIVAYLKGQMTAGEEQQFLKELEDNPELKEKAIVTARLVKGLKQVGSEQDKDIRGAFLASSEQGVEAVAQKVIRDDSAAVVAEQEAIFAEREQTGTYYRKAEPEERAKTRPTRRVSSWLAIAASLVGVVWLGIGYYNYQHTTGLGAQFDDAFPSSMIVRGADNPSEAEKKLEQLFADVKDNKNIEDAIHELSLCWEISQMETYNDYTDYSAEIGWNLAIANLKDNNKKEAKKVLEKLVETSEEGSAVNQKAKELLSEI